MEKRNIALTLEVHKKVEETKERFSFKTYNDLIKSMCYFFENNKVNPLHTLEENSTEIFRSDIRMYFDDLRKIQKDDSQSLRKFLGALEKNYLKPILHSFIKEEVLEAIKAGREEVEKPTPKLTEIDKTLSITRKNKKSTKHWWIFYFCGSKFYYNNSFNLSGS
ncbi:MAG: BfmA/BtgA family mobilization protein [Capnocytophaga sp.]|nr:BfmA/BtgA family mobilization protein [Capnocytophaga sp.]